MRKLEASMVLTGKFEFRRSMTGKVVLRVEEERPRRWRLGSQSPSYRLWRNANMTDLMQPELGDLLDLKNGTSLGWKRPPVMHRLQPAPAIQDVPNEDRRRPGGADPILEYGEAAE